MTQIATFAGGPARNATATVAGGCFWCTEAVFTRLKGVSAVVPGYTGGHTDNPTSERVYEGDTGHAEAVQIIFDPSIISYRQLLEVFFHLHDPTTLNRQGNDVGDEYRSAIFYHDEAQKKTAQDVMRKENETTYKGKIVTELTPASAFYTAEDYHKDYYAKNSYQPYCQYVIDPKIQKLYKEFPDQVISHL